MPDRWRLGTRNPFTVYRVADGAHDVDHAREHFVTAFRREEDARRAVDAVNAQADRVGLEYPAGRWRDVYVRVHGDKEVATTEQVTDTIRIDWSAPNGAGEVDIVGVEVVAATGVEVDGEPTTPPACDCPDINGAEPAGSAVGQRGAPTRDVRGEAEAVAKAFGRLCGGDDGASWDDEEEIAVPREWVRRAYRLALAALRDGGADAGGAWIRCGQQFAFVAAAGGEMPPPQCDLPRGHDGPHGWLSGRRFGVVEMDPQTGEPLTTEHHRIAESVATHALDETRTRIATALGVSLNPDDPDPVGTLVEAAGKAREVEAVTSKQAVALPPGSWVLRCHQNGTPWLNASPRPAGAIGSAGDPRRLVLYRAPAPAPAALAVGEVVESAADLATRVVDGVAVRDAKRGVLDYWDGHWHLTGMSGGPVVPAMPVRVLDVTAVAAACAPSSTDTEGRAVRDEPDVAITYGDLLDLADNAGLTHAAPVFVDTSWTVDARHPVEAGSSSDGQLRLWIDVAPDRAAAAREVEALLRRVHDVAEEADDVVRFYLAGDGAFLRDVHNMTAADLAALVVDAVLGQEET